MKEKIANMERADNPTLTWTVKEFAARMQISMPTAYAMVNKEGFPKVYAGKKILVIKSELKHWLEEQARGGGA